MIPIENHPNLMKSKKGLIIDIDASGYNRYITQKNMKTKIDVLETDILEIKQSVNMIQDLLQQILAKS